MQLNEDRVAVLIGHEGETKNLIEKKTGTFLTIDSEALECFIKVNEEAKIEDDSEELPPVGIRKFLTKFIVEAINMGFNPKKALEVLNEENTLEIIDLEKVLGDSPNRLKRIKGRLIGREGKFRNSIETLAGVQISIYKKYIAIIANQENMKVAKKAINMILQGAPHKPVLHYLQERYEIRKREEFTKMWKPQL